MNLGIPPSPTPLWRRQNDSQFNIYDADIEHVLLNDATANAVRRAGMIAGASMETQLRAMVVLMYREKKDLTDRLIKSEGLAQSYRLMTEGIELPDGRRYVFRPKDTP